MKKLSLVTALILALGMLFTGCSSSSTSSGSSKNANTGKADIVMICKTFDNPYWVSIRGGIQAEAKKLGIKVDIVAANSEDDVEGQLNLFESAIQKGYKAIGFSPITPTSLNNAIVQANKKGIYVVNFDEAVETKSLDSLGGWVPYLITTDNVKVGETAANELMKLVPDGGQVAIIEGKAGDATSNERTQGATQAFAGNSKFKLVGSQPGNWDRTTALDITTNYLQKYPNLKAIYACNDVMAMGAEQAVTNKGLTGKVFVFGTDGNQDAIASIKSGQLTGTVAQDAANIAAQTVDILNNAVKTKAVSTKDTKCVSKYIPSYVINKDNASQYLSK